MDSQLRKHGVSTDESGREVIASDGGLFTLLWESRDVCIWTGGNEPDTVIIEQIIDGQYVQHTFNINTDGFEAAFHDQLVPVIRAQVDEAANGSGKVEVVFDLDVHPTFQLHHIPTIAASDDVMSHIEALVSGFVTETTSGFEMVGLTEEMEDRFGEQLIPA